MKIAEAIFRAYDIRGTYPEQVNAEAAKLIGKGFGTYLRRKLNLENPKVAVGQDCRTHSMELYEAFVDGLLSTGCYVTNLGITPSPYVYFVNTEGKFDGGCNITASHNSKEYNGFKLMTRDAHAVFGNDLQEILKLIKEDDFESGKASKKTADYVDFYLQKIKKNFEGTSSLKVVVDTGNGVAGKLYPQALKELGHEVIELYTELDGTFPNHEADPIVEKNLEDLKKKVIETKAAIGLGFDGDGDRLAIVTEKGEFVDADTLLMVLSKDVVSRHSEAKLIFTVSNSQTLFDYVKNIGGNPIMCKVGHSYVENAMHEHQAILGGEQSGHFFLPENYYSYDDALITACRVLKILAEANVPCSKIIDELPKAVGGSEIRPYCSDKEKFEVLKKIVTHFSDKYPNTTMDGIRMDFGNGAWCGIRVSNTSPRISIILQAQSNEHLAKVNEEVMSHLKSYEAIKWDK